MRTMWQAGKARAGGNLQKDPKGGLLCAWKWGIPAKSTIPPICGYSNIWEMDFNGF
jgi:hypothetical protein